MNLITCVLQALQGLLKCPFNRCVEALFEAIIGRRWRSLKKVPRCRWKVVSDPRSAGRDSGVLSPERRPEAPASFCFFLASVRAVKVKDHLLVSLSSWLGSTDVCSCNIRYLLSPFWSLYWPECWLNMYRWIWALGWISFFRSLPEAHDHYRWELERRPTGYISTALLQVLVVLH